MKWIFYHLGFLFFTPLMAEEHVAKTSYTLWDAFHMPESIEENTHLIDWLFNYTTAMIVFFFILVVAGIVGFCYLYHHKRHPKAYYTYGTKRIQIIFATVIGTAVFFGVDINIVRISNEDFTKVFLNWPDETKEEVIKVEVLAQQWSWNFRQAGKDGVFNTEDDVVSTNDLRVPIGKKVFFQVTSKDVIHSFWIPNARRKVDAIPGRITRMWMKFTKEGKWDIACAEMCGTHHYMMKASLTTYSNEDFNYWLTQAQNHSLAENDRGTQDIFWGWNWN
ncbi:MAG: cytochrome c oxidase subunit II [Bacteriovoracales bacterium]